MRVSQKISDDEPLTVACPTFLGAVSLRPEREKKVCCVSIWYVTYSKLLTFELRLGKMN